MKRRAAPILIDGGYGLNASYHGPFNARIRLGALLVNALTREELEAVVAHEIGHRELYHVERCWALIALGYGCGLVGPFFSLWWVLSPFAGLVLAQACRWWHEFEADAYAMRLYGASRFKGAFARIVPEKPILLTRLRMRAMTLAERRGW